MANIFDYQFNLGGNLLAKMEGMIDSTAEFQAAVTKSQKALDGIGQACIGFESASNVIRNNGIEF